MGLQFLICPADVEEYNSPDQGAAQMVLHNAGLKADALVDTFPDGLVLGSDTTVALDGIVLNKPLDLDEAYKMLHQLSGRTHTVYTAIALRWQGGAWSDDFVEASEVRFKSLDDATIAKYFQYVDPLDKAGAYGIQSGREMIIERVEGSVENVMGLPIQALEKRLLEHSFDFRGQR
jgi:septum formation protein